MRSLALILTVVVSVAACDDTTWPVCAGGFGEGISVTVVDSVTNMVLLGPAVVTAQEGPFADSAVIAAGTHAVTSLANHRAGIYTVTVRVPHYTTWSKSDIYLAGSMCGVIPVNLIAKVQREPSTTFQLTFAGRGEFADRGLVRALLTAPHFELELDSADLAPHNFAIPTSGQARVIFSLVASSVDTLASHAVMFELHPNWTFGLYALVSAQRPLGTCGIPTAVALRSPTGTAVSDSLYLLVGGLPNGAVC